MYLMIRTNIARMFLMKSWWNYVEKFMNQKSKMYKFLMWHVACGMLFDNFEVWLHEKWNKYESSNAGFIMKMLN